MTPTETAPIMVFLLLIVCAAGCFTFLSVNAWAANRRKEKEAYYCNEIVKRIAESRSEQGSGALEMFRDELRIRAQHRADGIKLTGSVITAFGVGLALFLRAVANQEPVLMIGAVPVLVGLVVLGFGLRASSSARVNGR